MEKPLIRLENVHRHFQMGEETVRALNGITLTVAHGEFLGVAGPSGSGKSTLMHLLGGLDHPTDGRIEVDGQDISQLDEDGLAAYRRRQVGFIFQGFHLIPSMTALQNVAFPMLFAGVPTAEREQRARTLLERVGLGERMHHHPTELSGGQQQRVAIARALVNDPTIILADEPTGNLDTKSGAEIVTLLEALNYEGRTILIVSHDPRIIAACHRSLNLLDGRLVTDGE
ncbi:MAG: ABC transporter ATP-binding protein [Anaerolineales bacterium]